jgi:hypothetical protein
VMSHRASTVKQSPYGMSGITCGRNTCCQFTMPHNITPSVTANIVTHANL